MYCEDKILKNKYWDLIVSLFCNFNNFILELILICVQLYYEVVKRVVIDEWFNMKKTVSLNFIN